MAPRVVRRQKYPKRRPRKVMNPRPLPDHNVLVEFTRPDGSTYQRLMGGKAYRKLMAVSKGGRIARDNGKQHRWTSEEARKAAKKLWATRWRKVRGVRVGVPAKKRAPVRREAIRRQRCFDDGTEGPWFDPFSRTWWSQGRRVTERTALRKLGHLPSPLPPIPTRIITRIKLLDGGKLLAIPEPSAVPEPKEEL